MRVFLTGGSGFLGAPVRRALVAAGHDVVALARRTPREPTERVHWVEGDLAGFDGRGLDGCAALVHLAATGVSPQPTTLEEAMRVNVDAASALVERAADAGVSRILAAGSVAEYGLSSDRYDAIPVEAPLEPVGPYAASKATASLALSAIARRRGLRLAILRLAHLYGEGQHPSNFWVQLCFAALGGEDLPMTAGEQVRDFLPVERAADAFVRALDSLPLEPGLPRILHVGSGRATTLRAFAESEWSRLGAKGRLRIGALPYRAGETMRCVPAMTAW